MKPPRRQPHAKPHATPNCANALKGVVQCKAHVACVGPHVVRDLYGVIHHCGADFGIIVSRGGFTRGAHDFRRDKPILFLETDDLIAMQEGRDVLASAFSRKDTPNQPQEARAISFSGPATAQTMKEAKQDRGLKPGCASLQLGSGS
jgi:Restriction endonuclease.